MQEVPEGICGMLQVHLQLEKHPDNSTQTSSTDHLMNNCILLQINIRYSEVATAKILK